MRKKFAFIGVGNMANAIISGIISSKDANISCKDIVLFDRNELKMKPFADKGAFIASSVKQAVDIADCVLLCVKPQQFPDILPLLSECNAVQDKLFITIAAGVKMNVVSNAANGAPVVRVMPNTPMLVGKGVCAMCRDDKVSDADYDTARKLFSASASVIDITEDEMNRIISVTGSSPAYVFLMIKAMYDSAVAQGLLNTGENSGLTQRELINCICDTIIGTAELMKQKKLSVDDQIRNVASKGGTTEQALLELEKYKFCEGIISAMQKCTQRADELSD